MKRFQDFHSAFVGSVTEVMEDGSDISVKNMPTKELRGYSFDVAHAIKRFLAIPERATNPFAQLAETFWMLAGDDRLDWLELYIPQCKKWSDDGRVWRGAYGPRLRKWEIDAPWVPAVDQFLEVKQALCSDKETRQAIMTIWNPALDWVISKDIPCNNWLQFIIRDGMLNLHVAVRSNDAVYGFSHNDFFSWSVLLEMMAFWVGVAPGSITWFAGSYHIYEKHYDLANRISITETPAIYEYCLGIPMLKFDTEFEFFDASVSDLFDAEKEVRKLCDEEAPEKALTIVEHQKSFLDPFMFASLQMMAAYIFHKSENHSAVVDVFNSMEDSDMKLSGIMYLIRQKEYDIDDFIHSISSSPVMKFVQAFHHRF